MFLCLWWKCRRRRGFVDKVDAGDEPTGSDEGHVGGGEEEEIRRWGYGAQVARRFCAVGEIRELVVGVGDEPGLSEGLEVSVFGSVGESFEIGGM